MAIRGCSKYQGQVIELCSSEQLVLVSQAIVVLVGETFIIICIHLEFAWNSLSIQNYDPVSHRDKVKSVAEKSQKLWLIISVKRLSMCIDLLNHSDKSLKVFENSAKDVSSLSYFKDVLTAWDLLPGNWKHTPRSSTSHHHPASIQLNSLESRAGGIALYQILKDSFPANILQTSYLSQLSQPLVV